MKFVVVGVERSKGSFESRDTKEKVEYDNIMLHCSVEDDSPKQRTELLAGFRTTVLKVKNDFDNFVSLNGAPLKHFGELEGCEIKPYYNRFGSIDCISVVSIDGAK